jgi:adenylyltransferase/sulfurtransferase
MGRYHRQMLLPDFGEEGQRRLLASRALLVGCGALGCTIADLLVRAGVGTVTIVDRDIVDLTNLQRQTLYTEADVAEGLPKAEAARRRLAAVNSAVTIRAAVADFTATNARAIMTEARPDVLLDGTDNFETRYLLNDLAVSSGVPYVYGGAVASHGMQMTIRPGVTACLRCLFEEPMPPGTTQTCDTAGVLGPVVTIVAACQAVDVLKLLAGHPEQLSGTLLDFDAWRNDRRRLELAGPRSDCPCCGQRRFEFLDGSRGSGAAHLCGQDAVQVSSPATNGRMDLAALVERLRPHGKFSLLGSFLVRGELTAERGRGGAPLHLTVFADGRAIVRGTDRPDLARSVYARYVGG